MTSSTSFQPKIVDVHTVNPEIIAIRIQAQETVRGVQDTYIAEPEDIIDENNWVFRNDEPLGILVGADKQIIRWADKIYGEPLDTAWADDLANYQISSTQDTNYSNPTAPTAIYRKSKPIGSQLAHISPYKRVSPITHTVYLQMPEPLEPGETYTIDFQGEQLSDTSYRYEPTVDRSEAVHVSQVGFDPGDEVKVAFLSQWMGNGGSLDYAEGTPFWLIDENTGEKVYEGSIELSQAQENPEDFRGRNYNLTDVYMMDFSDFQTEGTFRVAVDGVGTSFTFDIAENTWEDAFYVTARGFFHQRSGIALGQPYTDYERPRAFHPDDGVKIYQSTVPLMDTHMGLNLQDVRAFDALVATKTDELVPEAWGGWFDAGDWDRRIQHLEVTRQLIDLAEINPDYFSNIELNILESNNQLADIVDEALWGLDVFRRLQTPEGGIRGGIESAGHPRPYEASWQESQTVMVYGPGIWSSYFYAATAAQAAKYLTSIDPAKSQDYLDSALRAMAWAEQEYSLYDGPPSTSIDDWRNLAALELYRSTEADVWHQLFLETTAFTDASAEVFQWRSHNHEEAAYIYSQLELPEVNTTVQTNARQALLRAADTEIDNINRTGFKWQKNPHASLRYGSSIGHPDVTTLLRAHHVSGDSQYLNAAILGLQFTAGANPDNLVFTTGLGQRSPQDALVIDARATGQAPPPGITVYGPYDYGYHGALEFFDEDLYPTFGQWPTAENYFDIYSLVPVTEFTVMQTMIPTSFAFGYLAAVDHPVEDTDHGGDGPEDDIPFPPNTPPVGNVAIAGLALEDQVLTADVSGLTDADEIVLDTLQVQWQRSNNQTAWTNIPGATASTFTPGDADVGQQLRAFITYTDGAGNNEQVTSAPSDTIANINDAPVGDITLEPVAQVGQTLTLNTDAISDADGLGSFSYQWQQQLDGVWANINDAMDSFFVPETVHADRSLRGIVIYTDDNGTVETLTSNPTNAVIAPEPNPDPEIPTDPEVPTPITEIFGTQSPEQLEGTAGNDSILGEGGNDRINGLEGDDRLDGGWGWDTLSGGDGNDTLVGGAGQDTLTGGAGRDTFVVATDGKQDIITDFTAAEDWLDISAVADFALLDSNDDGQVDDGFLSTEGNNLVLDLGQFGGGRVVLENQAELGSLSLDFFAPAAQDSGTGDPGTEDPGTEDPSPEDPGDGNSSDPDSDSDTSAPGIEILGTPDSEQLEGSPGNDSILGEGGRDTINGLEGDDVLDGGWGRDTLSGGAGNDRLLGGPGRDLLLGNAGRDIFVFDTNGKQDTVADFTLGEDWLDITQLGEPMALDSDGDALVDGDFISISGRDLVLDLSQLGGGTVVLKDHADLADSFGLNNFTTSNLDPIQTDPDGDGSSNEGSDNNSSPPSDLDPPATGVEIMGTRASEQLEGTGGNDTIRGEGGSDTLDGLGGNDSLDGSWGRDTLYGGAGDDRLMGGPGADQLIGGAGQDTYTGGTGADLFILHTGGEQDIITDFETGIDKLDLGGISFGALDIDGDGTIDGSFIAGQGDGLTLDLSSLGGGTVVLQNTFTLTVQDFA